MLQRSNKSFQVENIKLIFEHFEVEDSPGTQADDFWTINTPLGNRMEYLLLRID